MLHTATAVSTIIIRRKTYSIYFTFLLVIVLRFIDQYNGSMVQHDRHFLLTDRSIFCLTFRLILYKV